MTMAHLLGLDLDQAAIGLSTFSGANRRFEYKGDLGGVTIIDDYAHHPSEIEATINAAKKIVKNKLWIVFQPHTYTRTIRFLEDFARVLAKADGIILTDIYAAREKDEHTVHSKDLLKAINSLNPNVAYLPLCPQRLVDNYGCWERIFDRRGHPKLLKKLYNEVFILLGEYLIFIVIHIIHILINICSCFYV
jgi:UDP-N-acetylmuramate-alanine ligase